MASSIWRSVSFGCIALLLLGLALRLNIRSLTIEGDWSGRALYYGSRCLLSGKNPYSNDAIVGDWAADRAPEALRPGLPDAVFINPPSTALLLAPAAVLPWRYGIPAIRILEYVAALIMLACLLRWMAGSWNPRLRIWFAIFVLLAPATNHAIRQGQTTLIVGALLAASLLALAHRRDISAGILLGLSLSKFTLTLPFLLALFYRREWKVGTVAILTFLITNLALLLPMGPGRAVSAYTTALATVTAPNGPLDPGGSTLYNNGSAMIHAQRLFYSVVGANPFLVTVLFIVLCAASGLALAAVLRPREAGERVFQHPLEICCLTMAGLALFYHRDYDLALLALPMAGVLEFGRRRPDAQRAARNAALIGLIVLTGLVSMGDLSRQLLGLFAIVGIVSPKPLFVLLLFLVFLWMLYRDRIQARTAVGADAASDRRLESVGSASS